MEKNCKKCIHWNHTASDFDGGHETGYCSVQNYYMFWYSLCRYFYKAS